MPAVDCAYGSSARAAPALQGPEPVEMRPANIAQWFYTLTDLPSEVSSVDTVGRGRKATEAFILE